MGLNKIRTVIASGSKGGVQSVKDIWKDLGLLIIFYFITWVMIIWMFVLPKAILNIFFLRPEVFLKKYIYFIYLVAPGCGIPTLSCGMHVGSSFLTRD